jgi:hypothetical protein
MTIINRTWISVIAVATTAALGAFADDLYRINSKAVGWTTIDLTISEIKRDGRVVSLRVPHYAKRSDSETRFSTCAYTDIAIQRGYDAFVVSGGAVNDDVVRVGFLKAGEDSGKVLGTEFAMKGALRTEVAASNQACGIRKLR